MFEPIAYDDTFKTYAESLTEYKKLLVYAKIDGTNWYDISETAQGFVLADKITMLGSPSFSSGSLIFKNENNVWTPTQYNDEFDPDNGKYNGTVDDNYLSKTWEIKVYVLVGNFADGMELPANTIAYWRKTLLDILNDTVPEGITPQDTPNSVVIQIFQGWKPAFGIKEKHKTAEMKIYDRLWITSQKVIAPQRLYVSETPDAIIADLLQLAGFSSDDYDLQSLTTVFDTYLTKQNETVWNAIVDVVKACGGKITVRPDGKIAFRTRIENYTEPSIADTIVEDDIQGYNLEKARQYNDITVTSMGYVVSTDNTENLVDTELTGDNAIVKAGETGTFTLDYTSDYGKDFASTVNIAVKEADTVIDSGTDFAVGDDDGYIQLVSMAANPTQLVLQIKNLSTSTDYGIKHITFKGRTIKKTTQNNVHLENTTGEATASLSLTSFYSSEAMLSNLADIKKQESEKEIEFVMGLNRFIPNLYAGNLITLQIPDKGVQTGTFFVKEIDYKIKAGEWKYTIGAVEWGNITFNTSDKTFETAAINDAIVEDPLQTQINSLDSDVSTLQSDTNDLKNKTNYLDGAVPGAPTGLALATLLSNEQSVVTASWDANTETDIIGYEVAWSYDGTNWHNGNVADTLYKFVVLGNMTVYVKVRALDAEGNKSDWSAAVSTTSAKDETPPAVPGGLEVIGLFQTIMVKWTANTEQDFDHYELQYDTHSDFSAATTLTLGSNHTVLKDLAASTTYYVRIRAVDKSGNASNWTSALNASTVNLDSADYYDYAAIKTAVIQGGYIDDAWIGSLNADKIDAGTLNADRIAAGSITADKLVMKNFNSLPDGVIGYWQNNLFDVVADIAPEGYTEKNFQTGVVLTESNAPADSVVAGLIAGNKIYAGKQIQVGTGVIIETTSAGAGNIRVTDGTNDIVKIGEDALGTGQPGIKINGANLEVDGGIKAEYITIPYMFLPTDEYAVGTLCSGQGADFDHDDWEYIIQTSQDTPGSDNQQDYARVSQYAGDEPVMWIRDLNIESSPVPDGYMKLYYMVDYENDLGSPMHRFRIKREDNQNTYCITRITHVQPDDDDFNPWPLWMLVTPYDNRDIYCIFDLTNTAYNDVIEKTTKVINQVFMNGLDKIPKDGYFDIKLFTSINSIATNEELIFSYNIKIYIQLLQQILAFHN